MVTSWTSFLDWETPAGRILRACFQKLPKDRPFTITVFGSAPLQMMLDPHLLSGDVDVFSSEDDLAQLISSAGFDQKQADLFIDVSSELNFRTSPLWKDRTKTVSFDNIKIVFPHPIDILIAKLTRLDEKDIRAFQVVLSTTGHPTELELIQELQMAVDLFRPSFDEEKGQDMGTNCRRLWPLLYNKQIDPLQQIISPALAKRKAGYGEPGHDYKQELRDALKQ
jgi:hypothetical protein